MSSADWLRAVGAQDLPPGWQVRSVAGHYEVQLGKMLNAERAAAPGDANASPYLRNVNVQWGRIDTDDLNWMRFDAAERAKYALRRGDLLVCEGGEIGRCAVWEGGRTDCFFQKAIMRVRPRGDDDVRWLELCLRAFADAGVLTAGTDKSTIGHLPAERLRALRIPIPPPSEQRQIISGLASKAIWIDTVVTARRRQLNRLVERRRSTMFATTNGELDESQPRRASAIPWLASLPAQWLETKLSLVAKLGTGHTPARSRPELWTECTIPWITTGEVTQIRDDRAEIITETREKVSHLGVENSAAVVHPKDTVVLSRTASAGFSAIMGADMATSQDFVTWTCGSRLLPRYLLFCLRAMRSDLLGRLAMGSTHKTIYFPDIESIRVPLPPVEDQRRMLELADRKLRPVAPLEAAITRQIGLLRERRHALITAAVTGRLPVAEAVA